jgi:hypothetical protein
VDIGLDSTKNTPIEILTVYLCTSVLYFTKQLPVYEADICGVVLRQHVNFTLFTALRD